MINDYYKSLPKKRMASGVIFLNEKGEILLVKPSYKEHWLIVGGVIEENESPRDACLREAKEEISIELKDIEFVCMDYLASDDEKSERLHFTFYGGILNEDEIRNITVDGEEIIECRFVSIENALGLLDKGMAKRLPKCLEAIKNHAGVYVEDGA